MEGVLIGTETKVGYLLSRAWWAWVFLTSVNLILTSVAGASKYIWPELVGQFFTNCLMII